MNCVRHIWVLILLLSLSAEAQKKHNPPGRHNSIYNMKVAPLLKETVVPKPPEREYLYNIIYHRIHWHLDPNVKYIRGRVATTFIPGIDSFGTIGFDMDSSLHVDSIIYHGTKAGWKRPNSERLFISILPIKKGQIDSVAIYYQGKPIDFFNAFTLNLHEKKSVLSTLSEPYGAFTWWPCKQGLYDKIDSLDTWITVPQGNKAAGIGLLVDSSKVDTFLTYHWKHRYPISPYLVAVAVTNYQQFSNWFPRSLGDSMEILNYVYPEDRAKWETDSKLTVPCLQLYERLFIPYPFRKEKYGHAQFNFGGGEEHQTMSYMASLKFILLVHEMAHQWFGDKITCGSWEDIWLNEGFATYCEGLATQNLKGEEEFQAWKAGKMSSAFSAQDGSVFVDDTMSVGRIFDNRLTYAKGGIVLHMLRWHLGDSAFFAAIRTYLNDPLLAYNYAKTNDLKRHFEKASGKDLTLFFNEWVYGKGFPHYQVNWQQSPEKDIQLSIRQRTSSPGMSFYSLPLPLHFWALGKDSLVLLKMSSLMQDFNLKSDRILDSVTCDPHHDLLVHSDVINLDSLQADKVKIQPNPAGDYLLVIFKDQKLKHKGKLQIASADGRIIYSEEYKNAQEIKLPLTDLASGNYYLFISSSSIVLSKKFVKVQE